MNFSHFRRRFLHSALWVVMIFLEVLLGECAVEFIIMILWVIVWRP